MDIMNSAGIVSRLALLVLSAYLFNRIYIPPSAGKFNLPPPGPSFSEKREWFHLRLVAYIYPSLNIGHAAVTLHECLFILMTYFEYPNSLADYLLLPTGSSGPPGWIGMLGLLIGVFGGFFRLACYKALGDAFTFNITQSPKLVTSGPYSIVRHPSYLGGILNGLGVSIYHLCPGSWLRESGILQQGVWKIAIGVWVFTTVVAAHFLCVFRAEDEDRLLKRMFGEEWEAWRRDVRFKIYPGVY
ncbi:hypothetical protein E1B28_009395 [Marasmius oreades]|uniref:Protein-S-isoprenylcysteine O-methyltransferase n=1 Tax=Marasmius oreades TaxID=181124 RepID=A0A9P7UTD8_9AGAR|nr:uncharacterized protein E1B28_009395 [Marasmius oreades]KAG7093110.1 hypothetical protein E1B28_009395 [Marasmius oreades]